MYKKRVRLSFLVARTQSFLFWFLAGLALLLGAIYLFLMNRVSMQGYVLSIEMEKSREISSNLEQLDAKIARHETRKYLSDSMYSKDMIVREQQNYFVMKPQFTAFKELNNF